MLVPERLLYDTTTWISWPRSRLFNLYNIRVAYISPAPPAATGEVRDPEKPDRRRADLLNWFQAGRYLRVETVNSRHISVGFC